MLAAAERPEAVLSLTVTEPPAFGTARGDARVEELISELGDLAENGPEDPEEFLRRFVGGAGAKVDLPRPLPAPLLQHARLLQSARPPWEADIPLDALRDAPFPKLVVSGGHSAAFDAVCDVLEAELHAARAVITGAGHSVPQTGEPFNQRLEQHLEAA